MSVSTKNPFTQGALAPIFVKTALPIIFVMSMNGLLTVVDAMFLGRYVGADALGAVTLMFPIYMLIVALATLVSNGMSSILARSLGASDFIGARAVFAGAHGLALGVACLLILGYLLFGRAITLFLADGSEAMARMGQTYLSITCMAAPLAFVLAVNSDALRNEGRVGFMAAMSLLVSISNIGFNYLLIAVLNMGVAGSAYGTLCAQLLAFGIIIAFRLTGHTALRPSALWQHPLWGRWGRMLALGAPQSLNFLGIAFGSTAILLALQWVGSSDYEATISAYGIVTRVLTFVFLPLLGLTNAIQSIIGNNFGAQAWLRSDASLRMGLWVALIYCGVAQAILTLFAPAIGAIFVDEPGVITELARILPLTASMLWLAGPMIVIATYFQAIGDAPRAALLGLSKPYLFALPLTFALPAAIGEIGIWLAGPLAEILMLGLTTLVLIHTARHRNLHLGLFKSTFPATH
ncbi:MAG: MATE family efflux transporter [Sulfitobacter sp.]